MATKWRSAKIPAFRPSLGFCLESDCVDPKHWLVAARLKTRSTARNEEEWLVSNISIKEMVDLFRRIKRNRAAKSGRYRYKPMFVSNNFRVRVEFCNSEDEYKVEVTDDYRVSDFVYVSRDELRKSVLGVLRGAFEKNPRSLTPAARKMVAETAPGG